MNTPATVGSAATAAASQAGLAGTVGNVAQTCPLVTLEVGVFFDGTLNNRYNVISRRRQDDSYQNALSNPALLYAVYKNGANYNIRNSCGLAARTFRSIYVEGPGSTQGQADDTQGYALGMGRQSGVELRVLWSFRQLLTRIQEQGGPTAIRKVVLDVFGFSRGAAAARYFVNCIRARRIRYDPVGFGDFTETLPRGLTVEIRFVGVFDTVAAIGDPADDDNAPVNVHVKTDQVTGRIYHLTAGEEYRRNFRLNRNSPTGGGDTFQLPGAHSDVGGGYRDPGDTAPLDDKVRRLFATRAEAEAAQAATRSADLAVGVNHADERVFIEEGWIGTNEVSGGIIRHMTPVTRMLIPVASRGASRTITRWGYYEQRSLHRPWVQIGLSRVALHMMHEAATARVNGAFLPLPTSDRNYVIPAGLRPYEAAIRSGTLRGAQRRNLLREYGHVSMKDGSITSANWQGHRAEARHRRTEYDNDPGQAV